ncbi:hypothetical protein IWZ03DRAFT_383441 [Phyllosticta citriasiana]|uniref:Secreted protein n=1 Tax=Phyllosticta citriasiana TaxID=595635 RepID=A0ABR1KFX4_9PEZI
MASSSFPCFFFIYARPTYLSTCLSGWLAGVDQGLDMPTLMGLPFYFAVPSIALAQRTPLLISSSFTFSYNLCIVSHGRYGGGADAVAITAHRSIRTTHQ